jgi:hypothetical protein
MNADLVIRLVLLAVSISYLTFFICLAKKDGFLDAITLYTLPARTLTFLMGGKFWGEIDAYSVYEKVEVKLVGEPIAPHDKYPKELTYTLWGQLFTPEGRRDLKLGIIRPLWLFVSFAMFMSILCVIGAIFNSFK